MRYTGIVVCLLLSALLSLAPLSAQEVSGALQGRVLLGDSTAAAGMQLELTGANLQASRRRVSDRTGFYQFLALPPGVYSLRITRIGVRPLRVDNIVVDLGRTTGLPPAVLEIVAQEMAEQRIEASDMDLDPVRTTAGGTIRAAEFAELPTERDYKALIPILPQVNVSHRGDLPNVAGSTGVENQYFIDGVNVSDPRGGSRATNLPYNFVRAVDVKTGGYQAQYGRSLGAVVTAVTYSGGNQLEWSAFAFGQPSALSFRPRALPGVTTGKLDSYDMGVRVGGAVVRDRLWYSVALNPRREVYDKEVVGIGPASDRTTALLFASKLTWSASPRSTLELTLFGDPTTQDAVISPTGYGAITSVLNPDPLLRRQESGGTSIAVRGTFTPSERLLIETSASHQRDQGSVRARTAIGASEEVFIDYVDGAVSGGTGFQVSETRGRLTAGARATYGRERHTLVAGVEYDEGIVDTRTVQTGIGVIYRHAPGEYQVVAESWDGVFRNRSPAAFLQDSWRASDRLTINMGLRWSGQFLVGASGQVAQRITDEWQPRAGFSLLLDDAGRRRVFGSYGRFYQLLTSNIAAFWFLDYPFVITTYDADPRVPGANVTSTFDGTTYERDYARQIPGLEAENHDESTLGLEQLLGASGRLTMRGIRRSLRSSFGWGINPDTAWTAYWWLGTPGSEEVPFMPRPRREYAALELSAEGRWRATRYRASYVLSKTWGNYTGLYSSDRVGGGTPGQNFGLWSPNQTVNSNGYLPNDHRHVLKVSGSWSPLPRLVAGAFWTVMSGSPINRFASGLPNGEAESFLVPRGSAGRTSTTGNLDLRLGYEFPERGRMHTRLLLDVLRVGNVQSVVRVDELLHTSVDASRVPLATNARYGAPLGYLPPMAVRLGLEVSY